MMNIMGVRTRNRLGVSLACGALLCAWVNNASATQTWLAMCRGAAMHIYNATTTQMLSTNFGTNLATLAFSATATYDFYSPPLSRAISLVQSDKGGGVIYMRNTSTDSSHDFSVTGQMEFFDYDPTTGIETLIVDTTASPPKNVNHGQTVNWAIPNALLPTDRVIPGGHMVHIAMMIGLASGDPGSFGQVLYNGPAGPSTSGLLPQNRSAVLNWTFDAPPPTLSLAPLSGGPILLTCAGTAGGAYSIQATTNLSAPAWTTLVATNADANGLFTFVDRDATNYPARFYRAVTP